MTRHLIFYNEINPETTEELIDKIESAPDCIIRLLFSSDGGNVDCSKHISRVLSANKHRIELYAGDMVASSAFEIFYNFTGYKECAGVGLVHQINANGRIVHARNSYERVLKETIKRDNEELMNKYTFLTDYERELFKQGLDIHISNDRMQELCKN